MRNEYLHTVITILALTAALVAGAVLWERADNMRALTVMAENLSSSEQEKQLLAEELMAQIEQYATDKEALEHEIERLTALYELYKSRELYAKEKVAYLTFDDGPSANITTQVLDILKFYDIKATFFLVGNKCSEYPEVVKRIYQEGHAIGNHSTSHDYYTIYRNLDSFVADFMQTQEIIYSITGEYPTLYRYAGGSLTARNLAGSATQKQFDDYLWGRGVQYFDWNIDSGDASNGVVTVESIIGKTIYKLQNRQRAIILMHDTKYRQTTVDALPTIIETLLEQGYKFSPLQALQFTVQHLND